MTLSAQREALAARLVRLPPNSHAAVICAAKLREIVAAMLRAGE